MNAIDLTENLFDLSDVEYEFICPNCGNKSFGVYWGKARKFLLFKCTNNDTERTVGCNNFFKAEDCFVNK